MKKYVLAFAAALALLFVVPAPSVQAQISVGINLGDAPVCPYGYYGYAPYNCAPYGYYSDDWFVDGVFIGAGRWYHGPAHFYGHVNRAFDPRYGYHGAFPPHGPYHEPADHWQSFTPTHRADPRGNYRADDHTHGTANDRGAQGGGHRR